MHTIPAPKSPVKIKKSGNEREIYEKFGTIKITANHPAAKFIKRSAVRERSRGCIRTFPLYQS